MLRRTLNIIAMIALLLGGPARICLADSKDDGNGKHSPAKTNGGYKITFAGHLVGSGTATVSGQQLKIDGKVKDRNGKSIKFTVECTIEKGRFYGTGDADGLQVDIEGRVDSADRTGKIVRDARIVATYETSDGHHGRVAGERNGGGSAPVRK